ncbi:MAG: hypothetical protein JO266_06185 [Acidobacteria bacterium]|nr:hypothetical protein [Acidobacteriota bacterium]
MAARGHFTIDQVDGAVAFLTYRPYAFERPLLATWVSVVSVIVVGQALLAAAIGSLLGPRGEERRATVRMSVPRVACVRYPPRWDGAPDTIRTCDLCLRSKFRLPYAKMRWGK